MKVEPVAGIAASGVGRVTARGAGGRLPHRLRRLDEVWLGHGFPRYFLTTCVLHRQPVLANAYIHGRLKRFLAESQTRYGWWVTRYVVLPDHLHLLASANPEAVALGAWVKALKAFVSQRQFRWQTSFFDHVIWHDESESEKWEYIRLNPVRAGLVAQVEDWPYAGELNCEYDSAACGHPANNTTPRGVTRPTTNTLRQVTGPTT